MVGKEKEEKLRRIKEKKCVVSSDISRREIGDEASLFLIGTHSSVVFVSQMNA